MTTDKAIKLGNATEETNKVTFFSRWFWLSIVIILIGLIIEQQISSNTTPTSNLTHYLLTLLSNLFQGIGLAVFIANIFTFILGTNEFLQYIRNILMKVVISKEFITTLNQSEQQKLLHLSLKPSKDLSLLYSGINDYFDKYINESMKLFDKSYRGHLSLNAVASYNSEKECIQVVCDLDYIVYRVSDKFEPLQVFFEEDNAEHISTTINAHQLPKVTLTQENLQDAENITDPTVKKGYLAEIPDQFNEKTHININRKIIEYGNDHWQCFSYKSIKAYDGMVINLKCEDNIVVRNCNTYGKEDDFTIEQEKNSIKVQYHDWLTPGFGVNIIIALDNHHS